MNFTIREVFSSFLLLQSLIWWPWRSLFRPLWFSSFLPFSPRFSTSFMVAKASSMFMYFCAFKSISTIVLGGFFACETMNSLDFNPALKVVNCTLSSALSTSKVSRVWNALRVSFFPCLMVSKWSTGLVERYPSTKWHKKALFNCLKLSMDNVGNFVNHSLAAHLRVVGKERRSISTGGCWRPSVILKVLRWSTGSLSSTNGSS